MNVDSKRFVEVAKRVPKKSSVLDVGFGEAKLPALLNDCEWVGFEKDNRLVINAFARGLPASLGNADKEWGWKDASFDVVVLMNVLEHVENTQFVLREALRVLKPNGLLVGTVPYAVNLKKLWYEHQATFDVEGDDLRCFGKNELLFSLKNAGFKVEEITRVCTRFPLINVDFGIPFFAVQLVFKAVKLK